MVIELETMIFEIDYAGENLHGRAEFLQKKAGYIYGRTNTMPVTLECEMPLNSAVNLCCTYKKGMERR
jgi:hypothetical protein